MSAGAILALLVWRKRRSYTLTQFIKPRFAVPLLLISGTGALFDAYYNYRVTGHPLLMPWVAYYKQYHQNTPPLLFLHAGKPPVYRHVDIQNTWEEQNDEFKERKSHPVSNLRNVYRVFVFFCSPLWLFPMALAGLLTSSPRLRAGLIICFFVWFGLWIESFKTPHYIAGSVGLLPLVAIYGLRWLRVLGGTYGPILVLTLVVLICAQGRAPDQEESWSTRRRAPAPRTLAATEALKQAGRHLILVRYSPDHVDKSSDCVYNSANIDASTIVWVRDMGESKNRELLNYYTGARKTWLYEPDADPGKLKPYPLTSQ